MPRALTDDQLRATPVEVEVGTLVPAHGDPDDSDALPVRAKGLEDLLTLVATQNDTIIALLKRIAESVDPTMPALMLQTRTYED